MIENKINIYCDKPRFLINVLKGHDIRTMYKTFEGSPKETKYYSVEDLERLGFVGLYTYDVDVYEYAKNNKKEQ